MCIDAAVTVDERRVRRLPYTAHWDVGLGAQGDFVLAEEPQPHHLSLWSVTGAQYEEKWRRSLPQGMKADCWKACGGGRVLLQEGGDTVVLDGEGAEETRWRQEGFLLTCLPHYRPVYVRQTWEEWRVVVMEEGRPRELSGTWRGRHLSVVAHQELVAVLGARDRTLSIYRGYERE